jgi:hypothetical protein
MAAYYGVLDSFQAHPPGANFRLIATGVLLVIAGSHIPRVTEE